MKFALGRHAEQVQALEAIHDLVDRVDDPSRQASWYYWTGFLLSLTGGDVTTTTAYCRRAQTIAESAGLDEMRAYAECAHLERGLAMLEAMGARNEVVKALVTRAALLQAAGNDAEARQALQRADLIFEELGTLRGRVAKPGPLP